MERGRKSSFAMLKATFPRVADEVYRTTRDQRMAAYMQASQTLAVCGSSVGDNINHSDESDKDESDDNDTSDRIGSSSSSDEGEEEGDTHDTLGLATVNHFHPFIERYQRMCDLIERYGQGRTIKDVGPWDLSGLIRLTFARAYEDQKTEYNRAKRQDDIRNTRSRPRTWPSWI